MQFVKYFQKWAEKIISLQNDICDNLYREESVKTKTKP